jgi:hypothetical protein
MSLLRTFLASKLNSSTAYYASFFFVFTLFSPGMIGAQQPACGIPCNTGFSFSGNVGRAWDLYDGTPSHRVEVYRLTPSLTPYQCDDFDDCVVPYSVCNPKAHFIGVTSIEAPYDCGVDVLDRLLLFKHIKLGTPLDIYEMTAGDINKDAVLDNVDLDLVGKISLGS